MMTTTPIIDNPFKVGNLVQFTSKIASSQHVGAGYLHMPAEKKGSWQYVDNKSAGVVVDVTSGITLIILHESGKMFHTNIVYVRALKT